jgi:ubiquinone/menaquinone biosynthesis C-methylase UbiE
VAGDGVAGLKETARAIWSAGDYDAISELIRDVGPVVVRAAGVQAGDQVLDVAAGTGNASIPAAKAGAIVIASDLTPELFEAGRRRAADADAEIQWVEADAEALPFPDESFDVVLSTFGVMFAPRHAVAAAELARVLRSGGTLAIASWTPDGFSGRMFRMMGGFLPPPPDFASPPPLWGTEAHVEELFAGRGIDFTFTREATTLAFPSADEMIDEYFRHFGPFLAARAILEPAGRWDELRSAFGELIAEANDGSGEVEIAAEYLVAVGRKA